MPLDHAAQQLDVLLVLHGLQPDHVLVAQDVEAPGRIEHEGDASAHTGGEVAPGLAEHHDDPAGHVLAAVVTYALDHGVRPRVPDGEAFPREAPEVRLARRRAVEGDVADDHVPGRPVAREPVGKDGETAAGEALADVVVGSAFQGEGQAAREPRPEGLPRDAVETYADRAVREALVAVAPRDLAGEHPADRAVGVQYRLLEIDSFAVFEGGQALLDQLVVQGLLQAMVLGLGVVYGLPFGSLGLVEDRGEVHAFSLPVLDGLAHL